MKDKEKLLSNDKELRKYIRELEQTKIYYDKREYEFNNNMNSNGKKLLRVNIARGK